MANSVKSTFFQQLQKSFSVVLLTFAIFGSTQVVYADFAFFEEAAEVFGALEADKPTFQNNLIDRDRSRTRDKPRARIRFSLDQAASRARSQSGGGRVIKAQTKWSNGQPIHVIRVLSDDKRVKTYRYDGVTGRRL